MEEDFKVALSVKWTPSAGEPKIQQVSGGESAQHPFLLAINRLTEFRQNWQQAKGGGL